MTECLLDHRLDLVGRLGPESKDSSRLGHLWQNRVARTGAKIGDAGGLHFQFNKGQRTVVEDN